MPKHRHFTRKDTQEYLQALQKNVFKAHMCSPHVCYTYSTCTCSVLFQLHVYAILPQVLFQVSLAILKYNETQLLNSSDEIEAMTVVNDFMGKIGQKQNHHDKIIWSPGDQSQKVKHTHVK